MKVHWLESWSVNLICDCQLRHLEVIRFVWSNGNRNKRVGGKVREREREEEEDKMSQREKWDEIEEREITYA